MNTTEYQSFREEDSEFVPANRIQRLLREGWVLLDIRTRRPATAGNGSFEDAAVYSLAHVDKK